MPLILQLFKILCIICLLGICLEFVGILIRSDMLYWTGIVLALPINLLTIVDGIILALYLLLHFPKK